MKRSHHVSWRIRLQKRLITILYPPFIASKIDAGRDLDPSLGVAAVLSGSALVMAAASGKAVVEALICAALSDSDSDTDDDQWRHNSFLHLPPPTHATSDGAGQSGHGSSSWTFVDGADPRVAAVLADLGRGRSASGI